eukprot:s1129_g1.t2
MDTFLCFRQSFLSHARKATTIATARDRSPRASKPGIPGPSNDAWAEAKERWEQELAGLRRWKDEAAGAVQRMADGLRALRQRYDEQFRVGADLQASLDRLGQRQRQAFGDTAALPPSEPLTTSWWESKEGNLVSDDWSFWPKMPKTLKARPAVAHPLPAARWALLCLMSRSVKAVEEPQASAMDASYAPVSPMSTATFSPRSTKTASGTDLEDRFKVTATPQQTQTVKIWQLVLFSGCLCMLTLSTAAVVVESFAGLLTGQRPSEESEEVWARPSYVNCQADEQDMTEAWSDLKLDICCSTQGLGCQRRQSYHCDVATSDARELPYSMLRWCCAFEKAHCDAVSDALEMLVEKTAGGSAQQRCQGPNCPSTYDCTVDAKQWWLEWSVVKIERCCRQTGADCRRPVPQKEFDPEFERGQLQATPAPARPEKDDFYSCSEICIFRDRELACRDLIVEIAAHMFGHQPEHCTVAKQKALVKCPQCSDCIHQDAEICQFRRSA